jgi:hypothetical protein
VGTSTAGYIDRYDRVVVAAALSVAGGCTASASSAVAEVALASHRSRTGPRSSQKLTKSAAPHGEQRAARRAPDPGDHVRR